MNSQRLTSEKSTKTKKGGLGPDALNDHKNKLAAHNGALGDAKPKFKNQCLIRANASMGSKNKSNFQKPFVVIKNPSSLLGKRPFVKVFGDTKASSLCFGEKSCFEIHSKIIKGQTNVLNLTKVALKNSPENDILNSNKASLLRKLHVQRVSDPLDGESTHSTNDDVMEGSNEEILSAQVALSITDIFKRCNSKEDIDKRKAFFESFQPREEKKKTDSSFFDTKFPLDLQVNEEKKNASDFVYDLEIITNKNEKEKIKVSFQPGKVNMVEKIPNKMDAEARESFFRQFQFTTDYRSGYAPIDIQAKQEKEFSYKDHFIKKKQASSSTKLKRTCGVSYVKDLESEQLHVNHIFQKLPPLVFQGSAGCTRLEEHQGLVEQVFENIFREQANKYLVVTVLEADDEVKIREYLKFPERRLRLVKGKVYLLRSLDTLWHFFKDKYFVCIHLCYDNKELIKGMELKELTKDEALISLAQSNLQLGILCKRSTSGKKAFLKALVEGKESLDEDSESEDEGAKTENPVKTSNQDSSMAIEKTKEETKNNKGAKEKNKEEKKDEEKTQKKKKEKKSKTKPKDVEPVVEVEEEEDVRLTPDQIMLFEKAKKEVFEHKFQTFLPTEKFVFNNRRVFESFEALMPLVSKNLERNKEKEKDMGRTLTTNNNIETKETEQVVFNSVFSKDFLHQSAGPSLLLSGSTDTKADNREKITTEVPEVEKEINKKTIQTENNGEGSGDKPQPSSKKKSQKKSKKAEKQQENQDGEPKEKMEIDGSQVPNKSLKLIASKVKDAVLAEFLEEIIADPGKSLSTLSTRTELYTQQESWKSSSSHTKDLLYTFIMHATDALQERFKEWTKNRMIICKKNDQTLLFEKKKNILLFECDTKYDEATLKSFIPTQNNINWYFDPEIKVLNQKGCGSTKHKAINTKGLKEPSLADLQGISEGDKECPPLALPLYQISTRDSFAFDLVEKVTFPVLLGRKVKKTEYFFDPSTYPYNFKAFMEKFPDFRVGVTTYSDFFTHEELCAIEDRCYETERKFFSNHFLPMTGQMTCTSDKVRRTKFFFGARYMWTRQQLSEAHSMVGAGIRVDVSEPPRWMRDLVERPLVQAGIMEKDFVNSIAMNVYHDGKEGIAQHFDDAVRFKQPIFSLRIFSDSRLSFGSQLYGFCNGAFCIPMPRGCITIMEEDSYAANGIKHCVRPCDMTGKSAALILRQMHHKVFNEAKLYDEFVDFPTWFSSLSIQEDAVSYSDQKRIEGEEALKGIKKN